jgi:uncharacterized protein
MQLNDVHCHFFTEAFLASLGRRQGEQTQGVNEVAAALGWDSPGSSEALADRWVRELDEHQVSRAALIASVPCDEASVSTAVARHPRRLVGFFMLNPLAPDAMERLERGFTQLGLRGVCLFPAMHGYRFDDDRVVEVFRIAQARRGAVFGHCGFLYIEARARLGLPAAFDLRLGDPLALAATAARFPGVPVIVPHFGAGFLREALMAAAMCPNIHLDSSSSNSWVRFVPGLTLTEVFRRALSVAGADRILFGTDSSCFPRGWRQVLYGAQRTALDELGVEPEVQQKIFSGNFDRIFG